MKRSKLCAVLPHINQLLLAFILILLFTCTYGQSTPGITVIGTVTDSLGNLIPGATVVVENKRNTGASTNENGQFMLEVPPNTVLVVSAIGFEATRVVVKSA